MPKKDDINSRIQRAQRNARAKMNRIKKETGYDIAKTFSSPLAQSSALGSMSYNQKRNYLRRLERFNDRKTKFYVDAHGKPISQRAFDAYKRAEAKANAYVAKELRKYGKITGPEGENIIAQREMMGKNKPGKLFSNPSGTNLHFVEREATAFDSENKMREMTRTQNKKANPLSQKRKLKNQRKQYQKMIEMLGDSELIADSRDLTEEQFKILWNLTNFPTSISLQYETLKLLISDSNDRQISGGENESALAMARTYVTWAKGL